MKTFTQRENEQFHQKQMIQTQTNAQQYPQLHNCSHNCNLHYPKPQERDGFAPGLEGPQIETGWGKNSKVEGLSLAGIHLFFDTEIVPVPLVTSSV